MGDRQDGTHRLYPMLIRILVALRHPALSSWTLRVTLFAYSKRHSIERGPRITFDKGLHRRWRLHVYAMIDQALIDIKIGRVLATPKSRIRFVDAH